MGAWAGTQAPPPQPGAEEHASPCWPPPGPAGTFMVARMLWRSLSWMGWVGLAAVLVPLPGLGAGLGLVAEAAAGAEGAGVARAEEAVEDGVTAADWLRELGRAGVLERPHLGRAGTTPSAEATAGGSWVCTGQRVRLTWMRSCSPQAPRSPASWPGPARSAPPARLQQQGDRKSDVRGEPASPAQGDKRPTRKPGDKQGGVVTAVGPGGGAEGTRVLRLCVPQADSLSSDGLSGPSQWGARRWQRKSGAKAQALPNHPRRTPTDPTDRRKAGPGAHVPRPPPRPDVPP